MIKLSALIFGCLLISCSSSTGEKSPLVVKTVLPKELKEISGITAVGENIWAITDKPKARVFKLDGGGKLLQTVNVSNVEATDVEAVASDSNFVYLGDIGDNIGDREERQIIKVSLANIPAGAEVQVPGEIIEFTFPNEEVTENKKQNNFDCESLMSFKDSLYVFTKDREDKETKLYVLPKTPGKYTARYINSFNSEGLVTDAAMNKQNNELALIGYHKGHLYPFIFLFTNFQGNDFFSGEHQKIELANKKWDWQLEGITYSNKNIVYFSCEETKEVPATFYGIRRDDIFKLKKKKEKEKQVQTDNEDGAELTKKGHLKM
ncbi:MAG: hypothetical protein JWQ09_4964 [Segetibacter sp.]|nr:hypothetical protein [Segetibacter sp.]